MNPDEISLHIGRLVLHGFAAADRVRIGAALQSELQRLLAQGMPAVSALPAVLGRVDAGRVAVGPVSTPETIGAQVARRVATQLGVAPAAAGPLPGATGRQGGGR